MAHEGHAPVQFVFRGTVNEIDVHFYSRALAPTAASGANFHFPHDMVWHAERRLPSVRSNRILALSILKSAPDYFLGPSQLEGLRCCSPLLQAKCSRAAPLCAPHQ